MAVMRVNEQESLQELLQVTTYMIHKCLNKGLHGHVLHGPVCMEYQNLYKDIINYGFLTTETNSNALYIFHGFHHLIRNIRVGSFSGHRKSNLNTLGISLCDK